MNIEVRKLTDKMRFELAQGRILTSYKDFELNKFQPTMVPGKPTLPAVPGGIFDSTIFGSPYTDRCDCGFTVGKGKDCPRCHSHINTDDEVLGAIGLIKAPVYFINSIALESLNNLLRNTFRNFSKIDLNILYTRFFAYDEANNELVISDDVTQMTNPDFTNLSLEGLIKIFEKYKKNQLEKLMQIAQRYIIVRPVSMRPWSYTYKSWLGGRTLEKHQLNFQYQELIYISTELMEGINLSQGSVEDIVYSLASIRLAITKIVDGITDLINTSKGSSIRQGFGTRIPNSGRGVAVANPNLTIDQVSLPIGMCYEIFRNQFMDWIHIGYKLDEVEITQKMINRDREMISLFKKFVDESDLYVMINRAPTLSQYSMFAFEVTLNEGSSIGYSLMATTPLNLDFDGDTLAVYEIPEHLKSEAINMLPSHANRYMKSDKEIILPKQETLIGLMIASRIGEPKAVQVNSLEEAENKYKDGLFDSDNQIMIGTTTTTYGRAKLSQILGFELDYQITDKNISDLITKIKGMPGYVERMKQLQDFGLEVSTFESSSDISLENLKKSAETVDKYGILEGKSDAAIYGMSFDLNERATPLKDSLKGGKTAIASIVKPTAMYDGDSFILTSDSMLGVLSAAEYVRISAEFRKVQQVKVNSVGESGYLARQIWTAMSNLIYNSTPTTKSKLLTIVPDSNGVRYANGNPVQVHKGVPVKVDSVIYSSNNEVHPNDLYDFMQYKDGHLIGIDYGMQISEGVTQGILKLKHAGGFISCSAYGLMTAESDCEVKHDSEFFYINGQKTIKSPKFQFVDPNKVSYKKGELIGLNPTLITPNTNLYLLMKLVKAMGSTNLMSKPKRYTSLYAINSGKVQFHDGKVVVGSQVYVMPEETLCLVYEGQEVSPGDKLFTGALDYQAFVNKYASLGVNVLYKIFENELKSMVGIKSILIEFLFKAIHYIDVLDSGEEVIVFNGVANAIDPSKDLLTSLTLGFIKNKISKFIASDSTDMGESSIINVAYQFNNLRLGTATTKLIESKK